jgi:hypothetical protein
MYYVHVSKEEEVDTKERHINNLDFNERADEDLIG